MLNQSIYDWKSIDKTSFVPPDVLAVYNLELMVCHVSDTNSRNSPESHTLSTTRDILQSI
jgi:hypothetical protein